MKTDTRALDQHRRRVSDAVLAGGHFLLAEANKTAPRGQGSAKLEASAGVALDRTGSRTTATVFYDADFAVRQHEDTRLRHRPGRRAKWLERTAAEQSGRIGDILARHLRRGRS